MVGMIGLSLCLWIWLFSSSCFLVSVRDTSLTVTSLRSLTGSRRAALLLACCFCICCSVLSSTSAYADELPEAEDYVDKTGELSSMLSPEVRPESDMVAGEPVTVTLSRSVELRAAAESDGEGPVDIALSLLQEYATGWYSTAQANDQLAQDLAWRYYYYTDKQDKIPVVPTRPDVPELSEFANYGEFYYYTQQWCANNLSLYAPYRLAEMDNGKSWDTTSPDYEQEYKKWYDYYEGITEGGNNNPVGPIPESITVTGILGKYYISSQYQDCTGIALTSTITNIQTVNDYMTNNSLTYYIIVAGAYGNNSNGLYYELYMSQTPITLSSEVGGSSNGNDYYYYTLESLTSLYSAYIGKTTSNYTPLSFTGFKNENRTTKTVQNYQIGRAQLIYGIFSTQGIGTSNNPTEPTYPTYPAPYMPVTINNPQNPTYNSPTYNTTNTTNNQTTTTTADLTPILEAIRILNDNLIDAENVLNDTIITNHASLTGLLDDWMETIAQYLADIKTYLYEFNSTILNEMRQTNNWLRGIFYKLGAGSSSEPNIVTQPDSWWDWLKGIMDALLGDLPAALSELSSAMSGLKNLFPFSIPWDVAAILALFVAQPVTPVFDVPVPYSANGIAYVRVDLSGWDNVMTAVRSVELAAFAVGLAMKTRQMLANVEVSQ